MKSEEKSTNKEKQTLIIRKYHQYLKLEKALSPNTVDAYQTDLQKLLHFLEGEGIAILDTTLDDLQHFASGLHDIGIHPRSQARILSGIKSFFHFLVMADYLEGDHYFHINYEQQNLNRARTQFKLTSGMEENWDAMQKVIEKYC